MAATFSADAAARSASAPRILCAGIIVLDEVFRVEEFPQADGKVEATEFFVVNGGCAANAAVAIARLGGRAMLAGPLGGPAGEDDNGDRVLAALARESVDSSACQRVDGLATALSAIFINARGDRTIVTYRDKRIAAVDAARSGSARRCSRRWCSPTTAIRNSCGRFAKRRGGAALPVVLDADKADGRGRSAVSSSPRTWFFPPNACAPRPAAAISPTGLAAHRAPDGGVSRRQQRAGRHCLSSRTARSAACRCFAIDAVDTLGAGDAFHGGFALALAEGAARSRRCASAPPSPASNAAGSAAPAGAPTRAEVEALLAESGSPAAVRPLDRPCFRIIFYIDIVLSWIIERIFLWMP